MGTGYWRLRAVRCRCQRGGAARRERLRLSPTPRAAADGRGSHQSFDRSFSRVHGRRTLKILGEVLPARKWPVKAVTKVAGDYRPGHGDPDSTEYAAQATFLAAIEEHAPEPMQTLAEAALPVYRRAEEAGALVDWRSLVEGPDRVLLPYRQAKATVQRFRAKESDPDGPTVEVLESLRHALFNWSDSYHLTVDWLLEVALLTLCGWASAPDPDARPVLRVPAQGHEESWARAWFEALPILGAWMLPPAPAWLRSRRPTGVPDPSGVGRPRSRGRVELSEFKAHAWQPDVLPWTTYRRLVVFKLEQYRQQIERQVEALGWRPAPEFQGWNSVSADAGFRYVALHRCARLSYATIAEREGRSVDTIKRRARKVVAILNLPPHRGGRPRTE